MSNEDNDKNLPAPIEMYEQADRLCKALEKLQGSVSNKLVPKSAYDIGDTDERANPRALDLDYVEGGDCYTVEEAGRQFMMDGPNMPLSRDRWLSADGDTFIADLSEHN